MCEKGCIVSRQNVFLFEKKNILGYEYLKYIKAYIVHIQSIDWLYIIGALHISGKKFVNSY